MHIWSDGFERLGVRYSRALEFREKSVGRRMCEGLELRRTTGGVEDGNGSGVLMPWRRSFKHVEYLVAGANRARLLDAQKGSM